MFVDNLSYIGYVKYKKIQMLLCVPRANVDVKCLVWSKPPKDIQLTMITR